MLEKIRDNLYRITVSLPKSPLKLLNSYVVICGDRNLLIDTGFNWDICYKDLWEGLTELGLDMNNTDIFITHFHADHCGLVARVATPKSTIYMSRIDKEMLNAMFEKVGAWDELEVALQQEGYPKEELRKAYQVNPARIYATDKPFEAVLLEDGMDMQVGTERFLAIGTSGHTPGHMCLYWPLKKILFTGDHVLFDITPNIQNWLNMEDSLGSYMENLHKIRNIDAELVLTGHRDNIGNLPQRVDALLAHHEVRLNDVLNILLHEPGLSGYEVAARMKWSIRARNWAEFPPAQRWFAVGEAVSHLQHLVKTGQLCKERQGGIWRYKRNVS
ncbi:MBL fold metallo-hydrolase [Lachnospiraceae bacterium ZAX-1]